MKPSGDHRRSQREMCSDLVQIAWLDQGGRRFSEVGLIEDVSHGGVCLNLDLPVPAGATVCIHTKGLHGEARVCYCEPGQDGYLVGLEFQEGLTWDREKWQPKHLLSQNGPAFRT